MKNVSKSYLMISLVMDNVLNLLWILAIIGSLDMVDYTVILCVLLLIGSVLWTIIDAYTLIKKIKKGKINLIKNILIKGIVFSFTFAAIYLIPDFSVYKEAYIVFCGLGILFLAILQFVILKR